MIKNFNDLVEKAKMLDKFKVCVAAAENEEVLKAVKFAMDMGFIEPILVGNQEKIKEIADKIGLKDYEIIHRDSPERISIRSSKDCKFWKSKCFDEGFCKYKHIFKGCFKQRIWSEDWKIIITTSEAYEIPRYHKLLYCTDSGVNTNPNLKQKRIF